MALPGGRDGSRRILAWGLGTTRDTGLTRAVFDAAIRRRRTLPGLIFHSDRGSEYASAAFRDRLAVLGVRQSMTRGAAPGDNAHMESFFHSLKADLVHGTRFLTEAGLRSELRRYLWYYNHQRLHRPWATDRPLTMSGELRKTSVSTKPREDPAGQKKPARLKRDR